MEMGDGRGRDRSKRREGRGQEEKQDYRKGRAGFMAGRSRPFFFAFFFSFSFFFPSRPDGCRFCVFLLAPASSSTATTPLRIVVDSFEIVL